MVQQCQAQSRKPYHTTVSGPTEIDTHAQISLEVLEYSKNGMNWELNNLGMFMDWVQFINFILVHTISNSLRKIVIEKNLKIYDFLNFLFLLFA